jgi:hypothetical protein
METEDPKALREEIQRLRAELARSAPDLASMLRLRGFKIHTREPADDLLVPGPGEVDTFYAMMKKYSFRLFLRDVIKHQEGFGEREVTRYATAEVTGDYIDYLLGSGLLLEEAGSYRLPRRIKSFGETLEWFMAQVMRREFLTQALWGVKFRGQRVGGDYDLIARVDGGLLYMEVKSSPPKQVYQTEISAFMDRVGDLAPEVAVFFMDTELRMKDKLVPMFEEELRGRHVSPPEVARLERELFHMEHKLYIINSKLSITGNLERVLADYFRSGRKEHGGR